MYTFSQTRDCNYTSICGDLILSDLLLNHLFKYDWVTHMLDFINDTLSNIACLEACENKIQDEALKEEKDCLANLLLMLNIANANEFWQEFSSFLKTGKY